MCWIIIAAIISSVLIVARGWVYKKRDFEIGWIWWLLIIGSLTANIIAFWGFQELLNTSVDIETKYSLVLSVLSLLAAGVIAGNFAFSYQEASVGERILPNAISIIFVNLFYLLFGAVSYYTGKSTDVSLIEGLTWIFPTIMVLILAANTLNNY